VENLLVDLRATWGEAVEINNREQTPLDQLASTPKAQSNGTLPEGYVPFSISR
jgi:hypothetical protein